VPQPWVALGFDLPLSSSIFEFQISIFQLAAAFDFPRQTARRLVSSPLIRLLRPFRHIFYQRFP
jgi:hypothetical protein